MRLNVLYLAGQHRLILGDRGGEGYERPRICLWLLVNLIKFNGNVKNNKFITRCTCSILTWLLRISYYFTELFKSPIIICLEIFIMILLENCSREKKIFSKQYSGLMLLPKTVRACDATIIIVIVNVLFNAAILVLNNSFPKLNFDSASIFVPLGIIWSKQLYHQNSAVKIHLLAHLDNDLNSKTSKAKVYIFRLTKPRQADIS